MNFRPWGVIKKAIIWIPAGFYDRMRSRAGENQIKAGKLIAEKFDDCEPWSDHLEVSAISSINHAIENNDFASARGLVAFGTTQTANKECLELVEFAIDLLAEGKEILFDLYFLE